jgi:hypothetical protein
MLSCQLRAKAMDAGLRRALGGKQALARYCELAAGDRSVVVLEDRRFLQVSEIETGRQIDRLAASASPGGCTLALLEEQSISHCSASRSPLMHLRGCLFDSFCVLHVPIILAGSVMM